jgi:hypothetical protein
VSTDTAEGRIRSASARFASYHPKTGLNAKGKKAPAASKSRFPRFVHEKTPDEHNARLSLMAHARAAKKRAERGNTCVNGHPTSNLGGECFECRRARQPRVNEMRRLADAAKRRLADFGLEDAA